MKACVLFLFLSSLYTTFAQAQCAPGVSSAGNPGCIPQDRPESPYFHGNPDQLQQRLNQQPYKWADRWGAIATDAKTGDAGTVEGLQTKLAAEKEALARCGSTGASHCQVRLTFHNQCAAAALGSGELGLAGAPSEDQAKQRAVAKCGNSDTCKIVYSACSLPERIQ
jgi:hypothetical protein